MKRRNFCRSVILGSVGCAGILSGNWVFARNAKSSQAKSHHPWVILYWMPYDNDLSRFGEPIVEMLTHGTRNSETAVVVQSDYAGERAMRRRQMVKGITQEINVKGEDSSDVSAFSEYLDWAYQTFEAERWAVIVVGHGGKINEISPDDHGINQHNRTWMKVDQFANAISRFNQAVEGRVELLFFQNCNKATLEVVYEARNCAKYTLASQLLLGAPNYYYEGFLKHLQDPSVGGREAAIAIMESERADMYHTLTLVENEAVKRIPEKLVPLCEAISSNFSPTDFESPEVLYYYFEELHCDALIILGYLSKISSQARYELTEFAEFLRSSVIAKYKTGGELFRYYSLDETKLDQLCGLSLYFPETEETTARYSSLALYQDVDLVSLYNGFYRT